MRLDSEANVKISVIIPARNEEQNLPRLLQSLRSGSLQPYEILVVDDHSTDGTAQVAASLGAQILANPELPSGWTGKTWALWNGSLAARGELLLFIDADCWLMPQGLARFRAYFETTRQRIAVSALPYHRMTRPYENASLFFNLFMALGSGAMGLLPIRGLTPKPGQQTLLGQSLMMRKEDYRESGGHAMVRGEILENFKLTAHLRRVGVSCSNFIGHDALHIQMYPKGLVSLMAGWSKAFAQGAKEVPVGALLLTVVWSTLAMMTATFFPWKWPLLVPIYCAFVIHIRSLAQRIGNFRWTSCVFYPLFFGFFLLVFQYSVLSARKGRSVQWRGRSVKS